MKIFLLAPLVTGIAACAAVPKPQSLAPATLDWRAVATPGDRERLRDWRTAFTRAIGAARKAGHGAELVRGGALLEPDAALGPTPLPNGDYRCRVIKLGAKSAGLLDYVAYPPFQCRIAAAGTVQRFAKLTGSQRHVGLLYPDSALRQAFLGTLVIGDEDRALSYGRDPDRDLAGWVERIGPSRWRIVLPFPRHESTLDVIELIPSS